ncbi:MAG: hypothetical protein CBD97_04055 [Pelagibacteraceae bacterium TMED237]|nr:MAG: hypothetical protein CBD97_04055 [Pelagibacteraceae bacterium TMED237]|tara:strand:- start:1123 stop:1536 length:414 start_codon:yes stop_codon:yes gene_type:complete
MYKRNNGRTTYKSNRRPSFKKTGGYQSYKSRNKGNISQQYNKYLKLAKEAFRSGDRIQSEYFYQFTDHYYRLMIELGITLDENVNNEESKSFSDDQNNNSDEQSETQSESTNSNEESIESIPFIAEPSKDKRTRSNK